MAKSKRYSKSQLKAIVEKHTKNYPKENTFFATSDGQCFLKSKKSAAELHARENKLTVYEIKVDDLEKLETEASKEEAPKEESKLTSKERIDLIKGLNTIEEVEAALVGEKAKTVLAIGKLRITALKSADKEG